MEIYEVIKAVIFDWDGTIADTKKAVLDSFQFVLSKIGCDVSDFFIFRLLGIGTKETIVEALRKCDIEFDEAILEKLIEDKIRKQLDLTYSVELFQGAIELIEELKGRVKITLATMSSRKVIDKLLKEKNLEDSFDSVISIDEISNPKPDPEIFLESARRIGVNSKDCLVIEDSIFGVRAAKAAEMKCVAIPSGAYSRKELENEHPNFVVDSLKKREKILDYILSN
jgi:HAD superfamily hydrolase (TIGR01509 family)